MGAVPIHDWTRVDAGTWHDFHYRWVAAICQSLNVNVLPNGFYANAERRTGGVEPDVVTLEEAADDVNEAALGGGVATLAPPQLSVRRRAVSDAEAYRALQLRAAIYRENGDRVAAYFELTSPANKDRQSSVDTFAGKTRDAVERGIHVSIVDLFPPRRHDAAGGLVGSAADMLAMDVIETDPDKPLMIGAFEAADPPTLYAEPLAAGDVLPDLPVFLRRGQYVNVPLAATYAATWEATPRRAWELLTNEHAR